MWLLNWLFGDYKEEKNKEGRKRVFVSFASEDEKYRTFLVNQARSHKSPFDFIDMSVKVPYNDEEWKERCRTKIKRSHGLIVLLSKKTYHSSGVRFEIKCAKEEEKPIIGMYIKKGEKIGTLPELKGKKKVNWNWNNLESFINSL